jgi:hypothetical protein
MGGARPSETSVTVYYPMQRHKSEDSRTNLHSHGRENREAQNLNSWCDVTEFSLFRKFKSILQTIFVCLWVAELWSALLPVENLLKKYNAH